jgi:hypothetical protein
MAGGVLPRFALHRGEQGFREPHQAFVAVPCRRGRDLAGDEVSGGREAPLHRVDRARDLSGVRGCLPLTALAGQSLSPRIFLERGWGR